jgi:hypothetical protein
MIFIPWYRPKSNGASKPLTATYEAVIFPSLSCFSQVFCHGNEKLTVTPCLSLFIKAEKEKEVDL